MSSSSPFYRMPRGRAAQYDYLLGRSSSQAQVQPQRAPPTYSSSAFRTYSRLATRPKPLDLSDRTDLEKRYLPTHKDRETGSYVFGCNDEGRGSQRVESIIQRSLGHSRYSSFTPVPRMQYTVGASQQKEGVTSRYSEGAGYYVRMGLINPKSGSVFRRNGFVNLPSA